jgi:hypothetical protein
MLQNPVANIVSFVVSFSISATIIAPTGAHPLSFEPKNKAVSARSTTTQWQG